jgi:hypothetical protein
VLGLGDDRQERGYVRIRTGAVLRLGKGAVLGLAKELC